MEGHALELVGVGQARGADGGAIPVSDGISLSVDAGELVAVMGPSGSGKSTLLGFAGGLVPAGRGRVVVGGEDLTDLDARGRARVRRRHVGYVFQDHNLLPSLTALENVTLPLELDGVTARTARESARRAREGAGVSDLARVFPDDMSAEQEQRVAIARAMTAPHTVVIADEPTGLLDSRASDAVMELLRACVDAGMAGLVATNDPRFAAWADRTLFMRDGRFVDDTGRERAEDLLNDPPS